jgi:pyrimidine-nucleoside phosphorylase
MLRLAEPGIAEQAAVARVDSVLDSGAALERLVWLIEAQGGDASFIDTPQRLVTAEQTVDVLAAKGGTVVEVAPRVLGEGVIALGGGRTHMDQKPNLGVGFQMHVRPGDEVSVGDRLATVHARDQEGARMGEQLLHRAVSIGDSGQVPELRSLASHRIDEHGVVEF